MAAKSKDDVIGVEGRILFGGTYSFHTRNSINQPQGTFNLTILEMPSGTDAVGNMEVTTLWGNTTHTSLNYHGTAEFNSSTGYTTVNGVGKGIMTFNFNEKRPLVTNINISLQPGMKEGEMSIEALGENMSCRLTKEWMNHME